MRQKFEQFLDEANPASRCLLAVFASTPFYFTYWFIHLSGLLDPVVQVGLRQPVVWILQAALVFSTALSFGFLIWLWPRRRDPSPMPGLSVAVTLNIGLIYTLITLFAGTFTTGANMTLLGVLAIGLLLFDLRTMWIAFLVCSGLLVLYDVFVMAGQVPYAPAITRLAFNGVEPQWWWAVWRNVVFYAGVAVISTLLLVMFGRLDAQHRQLNKLSYTDVLTGLPNRRYFMDRLQAEVARQGRTAQPLSLMLIDADHFKQVNDTHGHAVGDEVLTVLARLLGECVRTPTDLAARLGGEEFAVLLPDTTVDEAEAVCGRIHSRLAEHVFQASGQTFHLTVSIGVAQCHGQSAEVVLKQADRNLYRAKQEGRNRSIYSVDSTLGSEVGA
ncbi:MAG: GGDEF domain-containing protein [Aquabacterium sp.]|uniref:GGDEF domain-containing protein n=1 Tax=Aquabacterium sp. TaxID=1872578 RepID=UPI002716DF3E|nr:GGDEF domain-containing protein [Aquabacterium sp.]MDO9005303.1 GGDEF domain-containing protein [Aquabacterium sp.]